MTHSQSMLFFYDLIFQDRLQIMKAILLLSVIFASLFSQITNYLHYFYPSTPPPGDQSPYIDHYVSQNTVVTVKMKYFPKQIFPVLTLHAHQIWYGSVLTTEFVNFQSQQNAYSFTASKNILYIFEMLNNFAYNCNHTHQIYLYENSSLTDKLSFNYLRIQTAPQVIQGFQIFDQKQRIVFTVKSCYTYQYCFQFALIDQQGIQIPQILNRKNLRCVGLLDGVNQRIYIKETPGKVHLLVKSPCYMFSAPRVYSTIQVSIQRNCAGISNSPNTAINNTHCKCDSGFFWNLTQNACQRNCSLHSRALGLVPNSNEKCNCDFNMSWNSTGRYCPCPSEFIIHEKNETCYRDCGLINHSTQRLKNGSIAQCECVKAFKWNNQKSVCQLNCLIIPNTQKVLQSDSLQKCICVKHFIWKQNTRICQFDCSNDMLSTGKVENGYTTQCQCRYGFQWNNKTMQCQKKCPIINLVNINNQCYQNLSTFYDVETTSCKKCHSTCKTCVGPQRNHCCTCHKQSSWVFNFELGTCQYVKDQRATITALSIVIVFLSVSAGVLYYRLCKFRNNRLQPSKSLKQPENNENQYLKPQSSSKMSPITTRIVEVQQSRQTHSWWQQFCQNISYKKQNKRAFSDRGQPKKEKQINQCNQLKQSKSNQNNQSDQKNQSKDNVFEKNLQN